jgi:hypothetical protein
MCVVDASEPHDAGDAIRNCNARRRVDYERWRVKLVADEVEVEQDVDRVVDLACVREHPPPSYSRAAIAPVRLPLDPGTQEEPPEADVSSFDD